MNKLYQIAVLTSGHSRGSNFKAIYNYLKENNLPIEIAFVLITEEDAPIKEVCQEWQIKTIYYDKIKGRINEFLQQTFQKHPVELIVLAGFMRKLTNEFIHLVNVPILNIHPALLPNYGGKGMFGMKVHEAVFSNHDKISGASVHLVNGEYDKGQILLQQSVDISSCTSPEEISAEVLKVEHAIYGKAIEKILLGSIQNKDI